MTSYPQSVRSESVAADPDTVIVFPDGLPGFETCREFVVITAPEMAPLQTLRSISGPPASFVGIDPRILMPSYRCELARADRERLGVEQEDALLWLALVAVDEDGTATANLRAPIVINPATMTGRQVMPHRCLYALRHVITTLP